ncbi:hypothetical protein CWS72_17060 [Telmatospirillum siberiense]|uniref:Transmembrane protein n=1 Tax=Telmatospirillum siberiense TaxID=382514 RepID=A0A2N3PSG4_9PROT|nr:hypothetical protein CWS72_17060 [Telmatospirillum siberiense]
MKALLSPPLVAVAVVVFLVEEIAWAWLARATAALGRWAPIARVETAIRRLPPYLAILLFVIPWAVILPVKLIALWLLATGHALAGIALFAAGELFGVGFLARIYVLCRPSLSKLIWFVRLEGWVRAVSTWAHAQLDRVAVWRLVRVRLHGLLHHWRQVLQEKGRGWLMARLRAAHRLVRTQFQR